ncbi:MAG: hypothetical protein RBS43_02310 [Candidatus Cloacimonas sp.]|jgi:hypothetical protein|nr:hypothetical protein [Candidatus Cloacimonas sp.]
MWQNQLDKELVQKPSVIPAEELVGKLQNLLSFPRRRESSPGESQRDATN